MTGALDRHFAPEGLRFEAPHPTRWYVRIEKRPDAEFHPPGGVAGGEPVDCFRPGTKGRSGGGA